MRCKPTTLCNFKFVITLGLLASLLAVNFMMVGCTSEANPPNRNSPTMPPKPPPSPLHGGIEIGSKGVKVTILGVTYTSPKSDEDSGREVQEVMPLKTTNTNIMGGLDAEGNFAASALKDTVKAVADYYQELRNAGVIAEQIYIVGSSGLQKASETSREHLRQQVIEATNIKMLFLTAEQEAQYSIVGIIPKTHRGDSFLIDIGSGNTKGGYIENYDTNPRFVTAEVALGTVTATNEMDKAAEAEKLAEAEKIAKAGAEKKETPALQPVKKVVYSKDRRGRRVAKTVTVWVPAKKPAPPKPEVKNVEYAERVRARVFEPLLRKDLINKPGFANRKRMYLSGGMSWALAVLRHPQARGEMVELTVQDIHDFTYLAKLKPDELLNPDLSAIKDELTRKQIEKEIRQIGDTFSRENLIAGGELLQALVNVCRLEAKDKRIRFARLGQTGWLYKFIEMTIEGNLNP